MAYVKLSDLGHVDLTFDSEEAPAPTKKKRIAEPTREEMEIEEKRQRGIRTPTARLKSKEKSNPRGERADRGDRPKGGGGSRVDRRREGEGYPQDAPSETAIVPPSEEHEWLETDEALYGPGGPPPLAMGGVANYPPAGVQPAPVEKENKGVDKYLPYIAGMALIGFLIFFWIQKRRSE